MKWPIDGDVQQASNFETTARKLRYQALGRACLDFNIQSLLVAHHEDDQAETVMMRIAEGHKGTSLKGILPVSDIPECWGMHGIHQSGAGKVAERTFREMKMGKALESRDSKNIQPNLKGEKSPPLRIEDGGIKIYRPLLGFDKERLRATCLASRVSWVEDETNQNPALTHRNAVRKLLRLERLPKAIQKASLLALAGRAYRKHVAQMSRVESQFRWCMIDTRVGVAIVRLSRTVMDCSGVPAIYAHQAFLRKRLQCALMVQRIMQIVTPMHVTPVGDLSFAVEALFPERVDPNSEEQTCKLTCGGVNFERVRSETQQSQSGSMDPEFVWILTRQPFTASRPSPSLPFPSRVTALEEGSTFSLWDGRFWFRIVNRHSRPVVVRPFYPTDLTLLRAKLPKQEARDLDKSLRIVAPGSVRWTLPVIAEAEEDDGNEAEEGSHDGSGGSFEAEESGHETIKPDKDLEEDKHEAEEILDKEAKDNNDYLDAEEVVNPGAKSISSLSSNNITVTETATETEPPNPNSTPNSTPNLNPTSNPQKKKQKKTAKTCYKKYSQRTGGRILALPTLNWDFGARERDIEWEVRYKQVKIPKHKRFESIIL